MNIAMLIRGPIRPNHKVAFDNIQMLKNNFMDHSISMYLWAWKSPHATQLVDLLVPDHVLLVDEPTDDYILNVIDGPFKITNYINCFKQYWTMKQATSWVDATHNFVVQFRADIQFEIDSLQDWLNPEYYTTVHTFFSRKRTNDQIGIATPDVMKRTWDYRDTTILNDFMKNANCPENILDQIITMNDVKLKCGNLKTWMLDPNRHILS